MSARTFISYSSKDAGFATEIAKQLRADGHAIWFDKLDIAAGEAWDREIEKGLKESDRLIVILSPDSVASENVMDEVSYAIDEGQELIPLYFRECSIPMRLRRTQYIDFRSDDRATASKRLDAVMKGVPTRKLPPQATPTRRGNAKARWLLLLLLIGAAGVAGWQLLGGGGSGVEEKPIYAGPYLGFAHAGKGYLERPPSPYYTGMPTTWVAVDAPSLGDRFAREGDGTPVLLESGGAKAMKLRWTETPKAILEKFVQGAWTQLKDAPVSLRGYAGIFPLRWSRATGKGTERFHPVADGTWLGDGVRWVEEDRSERYVVLRPKDTSSNLRYRLPLDGSTMVEQQGLKGWGPSWNSVLEVTSVAVFSRAEAVFHPNAAVEDPPLGASLRVAFINTIDRRIGLFNKGELSRVVPASTSEFVQAASGTTWVVRDMATRRKLAIVQAVESGQTVYIIELYQPAY